MIIAVKCGTDVHDDNPVMDPNPYKVSVLWN